MEKERLSTGAKVKEIALIGDRLNYELVEGSGPKTGWISTELKGKILAKQVLAEPEEEGPDGPARKTPMFKRVDNQNFEITEMKDRAAKNMKGDYWDMLFPHSADQLKEYGVKWLTKAFRTTGCLNIDNEVTEMSLKEVTGTVSGGAGLKYVLKVKYKIDKPYLQKDLFVKLPHEPKGSDRYYVSVMWGHDRPEIVFNVWLNPTVPLKVPKCYFCDICQHTTNYILITEQVKFAENGTKEFKPGDIEPAYRKYRDFESFSDGGVKYYLAAVKNLGKMAAYHKTGKLHPQVNDMFPMPGPVYGVPQGVPGADPMTKKMSGGKVDSFVRFMGETAAKAFPKEITDKQFLEWLKGRMMVYSDFGTEIFCYNSGAGTPNPLDYIVLTHNNCQVDNCIYFRTDENEIDVGMLDWGVLACGPFISAICSGCLSGASVDIYVEYYERFIQAALDSYEEHGGPKLDFDRMKIGHDLSVANWVAGLAANTTAVLKDCKAKEWETLTDIWSDERIQKKWNASAWTSQFHNALLIYQKLDIDNKFKEWQQSQGLPAEK